MKFCENCHVRVRGSMEYCPLCQAKLKGKNEADPYPKIKTLYRKHHLFFELLAFGTSGAAIISVAVNTLLPQSGPWSAFVVLGVICFWISLFFAMKKRHDIPKNIVIQIVIISVLCVVWDFVTGWHGWSLNYALPILTSAAVLFMAVISWIIKLPVGDTMICLAAGSVLGIAHIVFYLTGMITVPVPTVICITLSALALSALILFEGKKIWIEVVKRFHL